jgi:TPR repeat protein
MTTSLKFKKTKRRSYKKGGKPTYEEQKIINDAIEDQILIDEGIVKKNENTMTIRLAKQGNKYMQHALGYYYYFNTWPGRAEHKPLISQDDQKAFHWFSLAANNPDMPDSQFYLGEMYQNGRGTPINMNMALYWYNLSAEQGNKKASQKIEELS